MVKLKNCTLHGLFPHQKRTLYVDQTYCANLLYVEEGCGGEAPLSVLRLSSGTLVPICTPALVRPSRVSIRISNETRQKAGFEFVLLLGDPATSVECIIHTLLRSLLFPSACRLTFIGWLCKGICFLGTTMWTK